MTKEKLLWLKLSSEKQKSRMEQTIKLFEESLNDLKNGDKRRVYQKLQIKK